MLSVRNLAVAVEGKEILHGVSLDVRAGEIVALMGPNGSGKSTLAFALMGHPRYQVTAGKVTFMSSRPEPKAKDLRDPSARPQDDTAVSDSSVASRPQNDNQAVDLLALKPEERARHGIFLSFQYPHEIPGVPFGQMLRTAVGQRTGTMPPVREFLKTLDAKLAALKMDRSFAERSVNEGFSGGEKKRAEILQLAVLEPALAILDETDSGLDIDALRTVAEGIKTIRSHRVIARRDPSLGSGQAPPSTGHDEEIASPRVAPEARHDGVPMTVLLITHYERFLDFLTPDRVLIMKEGRIVAEGGKDLADRIQREGYETFG